MSRLRSLAEKLAWKGLPDLSMSLVHALTHTALLAQGAEQWTSELAGHRVQRYAFEGKGKGPAVLLMHGLNGAASSMTSLVRPLMPIASRIALLDLPGHGRSAEPGQGPLGALDYGAVLLAALEELAQETKGKVLLVGNSLGGALALYAAHQRPELIAGVVGLNPAGAELAEPAVGSLPRAFPDAGTGARRMAELLFSRPPLLYWLVGRSIARGWASETVQRVLSDARSGQHRALDASVLAALRVPVLVLWGADDRLLPQASVDEFRRLIPQARVELIPGCGHMPQLERPALTGRRIAEFAAGL